MRSSQGQTRQFGSYHIRPCARDGERWARLAEGKLDGSQDERPLFLSASDDVDEVARVATELRSRSSTHPIRSLHISDVTHVSTREVDWTELVGSVTSYLLATVPWLLSLTTTALPGTQPHQAFVLCGYIVVDHSIENPQAHFLDLDRRRWLRDRKLPHSGNTAPTAYFHSGSEDKIAQYDLLFRCFGIDLLLPTQQLPHKIEPQVEGCGPEAERALIDVPLSALKPHVATLGAYPFVIEDTMLFIERFNRVFRQERLLPGPDTKRWWRALRSDGVLDLMGDTEARRATYVCQIGLLQQHGQTTIFRAEVNGTISDGERSLASARRNSPYTNDTFFHSIFIPDGTHHTLGEMSAMDFAKYDYRAQCMSHAASSLGGDSGVLR